MEIEQSEFSGWAIADVLGHNRFVGLVTTEHFGQTAMFRVLTPAREAREHEVTEEHGEYLNLNGQYIQFPKGARLTYDGTPESVRLIGAASIYMLTPTTREKVLETLEEIEPRVAAKAIAADGAEIVPPKLHDPF